MREAHGTSEGEMLTVGEEPTGDTVAWGSRFFRADRSMGELVLPEAFHSIEGVLPHLHADLEARFRMALAAEDIGDKDPQEDDGLERRGGALGKGKVRFQKKVLTSPAKVLRPGSSTQPG